MLKNDLQRKKQHKAIINGLRAILGLAKPAPESLSDPIVQTLLGTHAMKEVVDEVQNSLGEPPQIVFIGKTGVGKSSTINELFDPDPNLPIDHVEPATVKIEIRDLSLGERGKLLFVDCPGLGVGDATDKRNIQAYKEILSSCDVAVWIVKADDKTLGVDQAFIKEVLPERLKSNLVIGINQVDKIEPSEWIREANLPSKDQLVSIGRKEESVRKAFTEIGLPPYGIVSYSAKRHYRLKLLFKMMLEACPPERVLALEESKAYIKSFLESDSVKPSFMKRVWSNFVSWLKK